MNSTSKAVKWTPGPWRAGTMQSTGRISVMKEWDWTGKAICRDIDGIENARLISKAPEMAELLREQDRLITRMATVFYDDKVQDLIPFGLTDDVKAHFQAQKAERLLAEIEGREGR